ncbi:MAG: DNA-processing protein DprA [Ruminococcus sp.]|nr:DNA-processing protein DprA [Ruminococcus sp.]
MTDIRYWIWFSQAIGYCTPKAKQILELYGDIEKFYNGKEPEWRLSGLFSNAEISKLDSTDLSVADDIISKCNKYCYEILTLDNPFYPRCLYNIDDPPAVLYVSGMLPDVDDRLTIGVVGTRKASMYGIRAAHSFSYNLAKCGITIISGGALGIDCSAHLGTLAADGVTVCVLGCGINYEYLRENAKMRSDITYKGAVISEYPPDTEPYPFHFPQRNRIISALSDGIFVVEAGHKSGALITVNSALEQDPTKKIFAMAGPADPHFYGTNELVKDKIAKLVTDYKDIIDDFESIYVTEEISPELIHINEKINAIPVKGKVPEDINGLKTNDLSEVPVHKENINLSDDESKVYYSIGNEPVHIDSIAEKTKLPVYKISPILTVLEIKKLIKCVQGRSYIII